MGNLLDYLQVFTGDPEDFVNIHDKVEPTNDGVAIREPNTPREE